jgi:hypothetical protein
VASQCVFWIKNKHMRQNRYEYDAFISHAVEDKIPIANELCARLEAAGLKIWYSGKELGVGDSIEKTIEKGLNRSRYGIVIFSPTYLAKNWTIREFYTLLAKEIEEHKVILPVLYNITLDELKNKDLVMADRFAVNADKGIDVVVDRLVREIKKSHVVQKTKTPWLSRIRFFLCLSLVANAVLLLNATVFSSDGVQSRLLQPIGYSKNAGIDHGGLLGEMQGLFNQLNQCDCDNQEKNVQQTQKSQFVRNVNFNDAGRTDEPRPHAHAGKKMTMAVVFQVETLGNMMPNHTEENETLNALSLAGDESPFITVKSRDIPSNGHRVECVHSAFASE